MFFDIIIWHLFFKVHIPFCDVDDLAFRNRHDPNFVASISTYHIIIRSLIYELFQIKLLFPS